MTITQRMGNEFSGPIIFNYVWWVLHEAQKRGIERLYFLARDGYTLHKIATLLCSRFHLGIECRYFYCSRAALRMPSYFFIGDEAYDLLFLWGYYVTLKSVLLRGGLTEQERSTVYRECDLEDVLEEHPLSYAEFREYTGRIRKSKTFRTAVMEKSTAAFENAIGYFRSEGLFEQEQIAVVDSGWTGSMQRSLRQLLEFAGYTGKLTGFYFGMYQKPKLRADGDYLTWYFNAKGKIGNKALFCNNLFECLLSAPHGMTLAYDRTEDGFAPVLLPPPSGEELAAILAQCEAIYTYAARQAEQIVFEDFNAPKLHRDTARRIRRYMARPTREEAAYYGQFLFCDDITEAYHFTLTESEQASLLQNYSIPRRILRKVIKRQPQKNENKKAELFWPFGTVAFLPEYSKWWYWCNVHMWELMKYMLQRLKSHEVRRPAPVDFKCLAAACDVVSFDIFDTLLYRTVNKPTDVFCLMEPVAEQRYGITDFCKKRIAAEQAARCMTSAEDITLAEIYTAMQIEEDHAAELMRYEIETEFSVLKRDREMAELLSFSIAQGKRVLIISDMYQDSAFLSGALAQAGISGYHALYVSSAEKATKTSGNLFRRVAEKERITDNGRWLHIGDNVRSDYDIPKTLGISAVLYDNGRLEEHSHVSSMRRIMGAIKAKARIFCQRWGKQR